MPLRIAPKAQPATPAIEVAKPVRGLKPYQAVSSLEEIRARPEQAPTKIDWNEATVPPSPRVIEAITAFLGNTHHLNWYPVLNSTNLVEKLARFYGLPNEQLLITNGSDDALHTICTTYLDAGDRVLVASPTYEHFLVFAQIRGAEIIHHFSPDPFASDPEGLKEALVRLRPRMLYLVNPNNPTGVMYTPEEVADIVASAPETLVIVDEAYSEFAEYNCIHLLEHYSNLVITRTFSKAYGMAGLRIGYAMGQQPIIDALKRVFNPKSVNVLAQVGAMAALEDQAYLRWYVGEVTAAKQELLAWATARGLEYQTTPANYVMMRFDRAPWVVQHLREEGIYVRDRSHMPRLAGFVRFSVGTVEQMRGVMASLDRVLTHLASI